MFIVINHIHLLGFVDIALNQNLFPSKGKFPASRYYYVSKSMLHQSNLFSKLIIAFDEGRTLPNLLGALCTQAKVE